MQLFFPELWFASYQLLALYLWSQQNLDTSKADDKLSDSNDYITLSSEFSVLWSHVVPVSVGHQGMWFLSFFLVFFAEEDWFIISHQQCCIWTFSPSSFWIEQWMYFVSPAGCVQKIDSVSVACTLCLLLNVCKRLTELVLRVFCISCWMCARDWQR